MNKRWLKKLLRDLRDPLTDAACDELVHLFVNKLLPALLLLLLHWLSRNSN
jgi:hypothetical protein